MENPILTIVSFLLVPFSLKSREGSEIATARVCTKTNNAGRSIQHRATSFKDLVEESGIFVDKSYLIRHFLDTNSKILQLNYPRGWGKSINLDMIRLYFQAELNEEGEKIKEEYTYNYKLFVNGIARSGNITKLEISEHPDYVYQFIGRYSVIHISFPICNFSEWSKVVECIDSSVKESFRQHYYLLNVLKKVVGSSKDYKTSEKARVNLETFNKYFIDKPNEADLEKSLLFLSEVLRHYLGLPVFILIDGYDALINSPISNLSFLACSKDTEYEVDSALKFMNNFLQNTLKRNEYYKRAFITGCVKISKQTLFVDNNVREYDLLNNLFYRYYGFSREEVTQLFLDGGIETGLGKEAKRWYKGFAIKTNENATIFNPRSISSFLSKREIDNYWVKSLGWPSQFLKDLVKRHQIRPTIISLINRENVELEFNEIEISRHDISRLRAVLLGKEDFKADSAQLFYRYCFSVGYLTLDKKCCEKNVKLLLKLPNREVVSVFSDYLRKYYEEVHEIPSVVSERVRKGFDSLLEGKPNCTLKSSLEEYFRSFPKFHGKDVKNKDVINSALNSMILLPTQNKKYFSDVYLITLDENKTQQRRPNIIMSSRDTKIGLVVKVVYNGSAEEALSRAEKSASFFGELKTIVKFRFLGVSVFDNKTVDIQGTGGEFLEPLEEYIQVSFLSPHNDSHVFISFYLFIFQSIFFFSILPIFHYDLLQIVQCSALHTKE